MKNQGTASIGYCYGYREPEFTDSMRNLQIFDKQHNGLVQNEIPVSGVYLAANRNNIVRKFRDETKDDWLVMVDCDIDFDPEMIYALYDVADPVERPIVSGIYFSRLAQNRLCPVWFTDLKNGRYSTVKRIVPEQPQLVDAVGMGFCIIHRSVFDKLADIYAKYDWKWFAYEESFNPDDELIHNLGEDLTFCQRAIKAGFPIYGHAAIQVGHIKRTALSYEMWVCEEHPEQYDKYEFKRGRVIGPAKKREANGAVIHDAMP